MPVDVSGAKALVRRHARDVMTKAKRHVEVETKVKAPHVTYELRGSIETSGVRTSGSTVSFTLTAGADHARIVAEGSRPHPIRPRRAKVLRFKVGGTTVYAASVQHPGTRPNEKWWSEGALTDRYRRGLTRAVASTTTRG